MASAFADEAIPFADGALAFANEAGAFANVAFAFANVTIALAKAAIAFANVTIAFAPEASAAADGATAFAHEAIPSWAVAVAKGLWRLGERRGMGRGGNPFAKIRSEALKQGVLASPEEGVKQEKTVFFDPCGRLGFAFCVKEKAFVEPIYNDALIRSLIFTFERKSDWMVHLPGHAPAPPGGDVDVPEDPTSPPFDASCPSCGISPVLSGLPQARYGTAAAGPTLPHEGAEP